MKDIELPPLPEPDICRYVVTVWRDGVECEIDNGPRYTVEQMQAYARAAVEADRAQRVPDGWKQEAAEAIDWLLNNIRRDAPQLSGKAMGNAVRVRDALLASTPAPAQQEPSEAEMVCAETYQVVGCLLSDLGLFETEAARKILDNLSEARMVHQDVLPWEPAAQHQEPPQQERKPMTDEQDRALCEAFCNAASDGYFKARPQLDSDVNRRIFYAGHRKAWLEWQTAHGIKE